MYFCLSIIILRSSDLVYSGPFQIVRRLGENMSSDEDVAAASRHIHFIGKKENIIQARRVVKSVDSGGPLQEGDIEDFDGRTCIVCPWHKYKITLAEGEGLYQAVDPSVKPLKPTWCSKGIKQRVHSVTVSNEDVFLTLNDSPGPIDSDHYQTEKYRNTFLKDGQKKTKAATDPLAVHCLIARPKKYTLYTFILHTLHSKHAFQEKEEQAPNEKSAQKKAVEERFASSGRGTSGVCAVPAPVPARVPVAKTSKCPVAVPIPLAVIAPIDVPAEVPPAKPVALEVSVTDGIKDEVVKAAEDLGQTPVEPPAKEPDATEEGASVVIPVSEPLLSLHRHHKCLGWTSTHIESGTGQGERERGTYPCSECQVCDSMGLILSWFRGPREPVDLLDVSVETQVTSSTDEPVSIPTESEVQFEDTTLVATETLVVAQPVETVDTEQAVEAELLAEDPVVEVPMPEEETVTAAESVAAVETVTETVVTEVEPVADTAVEVDGHVIGVVGEPVIEAEAITVEKEPAEVHTVTEVTEEAVVPTEALVEPEPEQQQPVLLEEPTPSVESTSDPIAEEFVVTESVAVDTTVAEEQIPEITTDAPKGLSETLSETIPAPEPLPVPDLAVAGGLTVDAINGCLGATEVAIEG
ncbi:Rieske domain-containing protein [Labeo rohita]|uniref:Rieske domain-containing protein n=1 Tax=Labeo rohita TaxID=84645 RepID=A0ABQ8MFA4_LABRO|nr:Rieske domain-containing protein [Labeo rohita]